MLPIVPGEILTGISTSVVLVAFVAGAGISIAASAVMIRALERFGAKLGFTEAVLGLTAALAADMPEITSSVTALLRHQHDVGIGVVFGSNVFNVAALLGLGAVVAGRVPLHRRVVILEGVVGMAVAFVAVATTRHSLAAPIGLTLALLIVLPYIAVAALIPRNREKIPLPTAWRHWLVRALAEEEVEIRPALGRVLGRTPDPAVIALALVVVIGSSVLMESAATTFGSRFSIPEIITGGVILAAVTSLPNLVAAIYLARAGRASAMLSEAMNSNTINSVAGFFLPAAFLGMAKPSGPGVLVVGCYAGFSLAALISAYIAKGLRRVQGFGILIAYGAFVIALTLYR